MPPLLPRPVVSFTWPTNSQPVVTLSGICGAAKAEAGTIQQVTFAIYDETLGQCWNGSGYQGTRFDLSATWSDPNWAAVGPLVLPTVACGHSYQISAKAVDSASNTGEASVTVNADRVAPLSTFAPLMSGQVVANLSTIGGTVTDNFGLIESIAITIHELDPAGGAGRWWNGSWFQPGPATVAGGVSGNGWSPAPGVKLPALNSGQQYELTVTATDTTCNTGSSTITVQAPIAVLGWDPGATPAGTVAFPAPNTNGGNYWFQITPQTPAVGVWRTALEVQAGEADVYLRHGSQPNTNNYTYGSRRTGSDGFVLDASQFNPGENWFVLVSASANAQ